MIDLNDPLVHEIVTLMTNHLGSPEDAQLWLTTPSIDFEKTPLHAILTGESVLAYMKDRFGPGPVEESLHVAII